MRLCIAGCQKLVAVKLLRRDLAEDEAFRGTIFDESHLVARLSYPTFVPEQ
jgi:hypothetical protein